MKSLTLTYDEWYQMLKDGHIVVVRNGFEIDVELLENGETLITVVNPYDKVKCNTVRP